MTERRCRYNFNSSSSARPNRLLSHGRRSVDAIEPKVKSARVADRIADGVAAPHRSGFCAAVGTRQTHATTGR